MNSSKLLIVVFVASVLNSGCTAIAVVDAAASTAIGVTKVAVKGGTAAVKGTAAVVGAVIPDGDSKKKKKAKH